MPIREEPIAVQPISSLDPILMDKNRIQNIKKKVEVVVEITKNNSLKVNKAWTMADKQRKEIHTYIYIYM